jgi:hypothetical protein
MAVITECFYLLDFSQIQENLDKKKGLRFSFEKGIIPRADRRQYRPSHGSGDATPAAMADF